MDPENPGEEYIEHSVNPFADNVYAEIVEKFFAEEMHLGGPSFL